MRRETMIIADNIIRESLKNVFFLCGGAYGGKTTMAKIIEEKYNFYRYRQGDHSDEYAEIAELDYQPNISLDRSKDWYGFFSQPVEAYYNYLTDALREEAEFAIVDLIKVACKTDKKIIYDGQIPIDILKQIANPRQVILLFAPVEMKKNYYFPREDKDDIYQFIKSLPNSDFLLENTRNALIFNGEKEIASFYDSGFKCIERTEQDTIKGTLDTIESYFKLSVHNR